MIFFERGAIYFLVPQFSIFSLYKKSYFYQVTTSIIWDSCLLYTSDAADE